MQQSNWLGVRESNACLIFLSRGQIFLSKEQLSWQLMKKLPLPFHVDCNLLWFEIRTESKGFDIREYSNKAMSDPVLLVSISFVQSLLALCFLFSHSKYKQRKYKTMIFDISCHLLDMILIWIWYLSVRCKWLALGSIWLIGNRQKDWWLSS